MDSSFAFEPPSDEELEYEHDSQDENDEEEEILRKPSQSAWEFTSYSESVAEEHARRSTTSIDEKISKIVQRSHPIATAADEEVSSDSEPDHQEDFKPQDDDDDDDNVNDAGCGDTKPFFASSDGVSFHANSFLDLHLSRPFLRACEVLGYTKPMPIQAACIPFALTGRDICGSAITGSGKE